MIRRGVGEIRDRQLLQGSVCARSTGVWSSFGAAGPAANAEPTQKTQTLREYKCLTLAREFPWLCLATPARAIREVALMWRDSTMDEFSLPRRVRNGRRVFMWRDDSRARHVGGNIRRLSAIHLRASLLVPTLRRGAPWQCRDSAAWDRPAAMAEN